MLEKYLEDLRVELDRREVDDREGILQYFEEIINDRIDNGESEEEIIASLGPAQELMDGIYEKKERIESRPSESDKETIVLRHIRDIDISVQSYDVKIMSCEGDCGRLEYDRNEDEGLDVEIKGSKLSIEQNVSLGIIDTFFAKIFHNGSGTFNGHLDIWLPKEEIDDLEISTVSGDLEICDLCADEVEINTVSGDLKLSRMQVEEADLNVVSGDVSMDHVLIEDELEIDSVSGDVDARNISCPKISVSTVSGDADLLIDGVRSDYTVEISAINEHRAYAGSGKGRLSFSTVSGDIDYVFTE